MEGLDVDPVTTVKYLVSVGLLRGVKFSTFDGRDLEIGLTTATSTAFSNPDALFTDMQVRTLSVNGVVAITAATFNYTTP